uniref:Secreted protein n=1 Tax=Mesocestoides corti TaxID=53468 RepID=A0A5K3FCG3_MESCO
MRSLRSLAFPFFACCNRLSSRFFTPTCFLNPGLSWQLPFPPFTDLRHYRKS